MEARNRLVSLSRRPIAVGVVGAVLLFALTLLVLVTLNGMPRTTHLPILVAPRIITSPEEYGDANGQGNVVTKTVSSTSAIHTIAQRTLRRPAK
jgi:hypothetical protein